MEVQVLWRKRWCLLPADGNGVTARWGRKEPEAKLRPEEHEPHTRLGDVGEPAAHGEARHLGEQFG